MLKRALPFGIALAVIPLAAPAYAQAWSYEGGSGETVTLDAVPTRIVAHSDAAAGLMAFGIRPVAIFADSPVAQSRALEGLDLSGIEIVGTAWGEVDLEAVAALDPDLIVAEYWPREDSWSGGDVSDPGSLLRAIAPLTGPRQGESIVTLIEDYEALAQSLGADLDAPQIAADRERFETAQAEFVAALEAKPGLDAMAVWAGADGLYIADPGGAAELSDLEAWGLDLIGAQSLDVYNLWQTVSWEEIDAFQPDLVLVDDRTPAALETAEAQPTWTSIRAVAAGQVAAWPAFRLRNHAQYAEALDDLTAAIAAADASVGD